MFIPTLYGRWKMEFFLLGIINNNSFFFTVGFAFFYILLWYFLLLSLCVQTVVRYTKGMSVIVMKKLDNIHRLTRGCNKCLDDEANHSYNAIKNQIIGQLLKQRGEGISLKKLFANLHIIIIFLQTKLNMI